MFPSWNGQNHVVISRLLWQNAICLVWFYALRRILNISRRLFWHKKTQNRQPIICQRWRVCFNTRCSVKFREISSGILNSIIPSTKGIWNHIKFRKKMVVNVLGIKGRRAKNQLENWGSVSKHKLMCENSSDCPSPPSPYQILKSTVIQNNLPNVDQHAGVEIVHPRQQTLQWVLVTKPDT